MSAQEPLSQHGSHPQELAVAIETLALSVHQLQAALAGETAREPWRDSALGHQTRVVRSGPCRLLWLDVTNDAGAALAWLHLFDEYNPDAVPLGDRQPTLSVAVKANDVREVRYLRPVLFRRGIVAVVSSDRAGASAAGASLLVNVLTVPT